MSLTKEDIINAVAEMSVKDVVELIEAMEEKFGVSAAAAVAAADVSYQRSSMVGVSDRPGRLSARSDTVCAETCCSQKFAQL